MKLTPAYIESQVLYCDYQYDGTHTTCTITTHHGSKHVGTSACLDPANYDKEIGEQIARKNAVDQLWALEGYLVGKLGLALVPGELKSVSAAAPAPAKYDGSQGWKRTVEVEFTVARKTGELNPDTTQIIESWDTAKTAEVHVVNYNTTLLHLDPAGIAADIKRTPQFGRYVIEVVLANRRKLGLPGYGSGGPVSGIDPAASAEIGCGGMDASWGHE